MKKLLTNGILMLLIVAFMAFTVSAQTPACTACTITDNVFLGGEGQKASNPEEDDGPIVEFNAITLVVTDDSSNTLSTAIGSGQTATVVISSISVESKYTNGNNNPSLAQASFSNLQPFENVLENDAKLIFFELQENTGLDFTPTGTNSGTPGSDNFILRAMIPANLDAVDNLLKPISFKVATVTFDILDPSQTVIAQFTKEVFMQRENNLEINDMDAEINSKDKESVDDGDKIDRLRPSDRVDLEIEVENRFNSNSEQSIEDVTLEIDCKNDDGLDFDDNSEDLGDIREDDKQTETISFDVEDDAKDETTDCEVNVDGTDESGAKHGDILQFDVEVERDNHDLQIQSVNLNPTVLQCEDTEFQLQVNIRNLGRSRERRPALEVVSTGLNYQSRLSNLGELEEDDEEQELFVIPVPANREQGVKAIQIQSFYDNIKLSDTEIVQIEDLCGASQPTTPTTPTSQTPDSLSVDKDLIKSMQGKKSSISVTVINEELVPVEYVVSLENLEDFANPGSSKTLFLNPSQSETVFLNFNVKEDAETGTYTATVKLKDSATGRTVDRTNFNVEVEGEEDKGFSFGLGGDSSRIFWIIADIILVIVAIFFVKLIFTGTSKKKRAKKMADFEAAEGFGTARQ